MIEITSTLRARTHLAATVAAPASAREGKTEAAKRKLQIRGLPIEKINALPSFRKAPDSQVIALLLPLTHPRVSLLAACRTVYSRLPRGPRTAHSALQEQRRDATRTSLRLLVRFIASTKKGISSRACSLRAPATHGRPAGCVSPRGPSAPRTAPPTNAEQTFRELWTCGQAPSL